MENQVGFEINQQETLELQYFQKIQVQKQEIKALQFENGTLKSEIEHLKHELSKPVDKRVEEAKKAFKREKHKLIKERDLLLYKYNGLRMKLEK